MSYKVHIGGFHFRPFRIKIGLSFWHVSLHEKCLLKHEVQKGMNLRKYSVSGLSLIANKTFNQHKKMLSSWILSSTQKMIDKVISPVLIRVPSVLVIITVTLLLLLLLLVVFVMAKLMDVLTPACYCCFASRFMIPTVVIVTGYSRGWNQATLISPQMFKSSSISAAWIMQFYVFSE